MNYIVLTSYHLKLESNNKIIYTFILWQQILWFIPQVFLRIYIECK